MYLFICIEKFGTINSNNNDNEENTFNGFIYPN